MTTPLDRVKALNYDHHRRMTEMHNQDLATGNTQVRAAVDDLSYRALLMNVPRWRTAILELGSASGQQWPLLSEWLTSDGHLIGIDLYAPLVARAQAEGLNIVEGYVEQMSMFGDDIFDLVCSRHVMEHLGDVARGMAEILRVTQRGGYIAHVTPNMAVDNEPAHLNHLDANGWAAAWTTAGLQVETVMRHPYHGGEVHIVGRKV